MPNLVGVWNPSLPQESIQKMIGNQLQRVRVPMIAYSEYKCDHQGFGMALIDHGLFEHGEKHARTTYVRYFLFLYGEIYNATELKRSHSPNIPETALTTPTH